jgi:hypothetical protein
MEEVFIIIICHLFLKTFLLIFIIWFSHKIKRFSLSMPIIFIRNFYFSNMQNKVKSWETNGSISCGKRKKIFNVLIQSLDFSSMMKIQAHFHMNRLVWPWKFISVTMYNCGVTLPTWFTTKEKDMKVKIKIIKPSITLQLECLLIGPRQKVSAHCNLLNSMLNLILTWGYLLQ